MVDDRSQRGSCSSLKSLPTRFLISTLSGIFCTLSCRIPVAALLAYQAGSQLPPQWQLTASALGAAVAFAAHAGKTALRLGVNATPEPLTNAMVSTAEDGAAVGLTWLATVHPYAAASVAILCIVALMFAIRLILRGLRNGVAVLKQQLKRSGANLNYSRPGSFDSDRPE